MNPRNRHPDSCDCRNTVGQWYRAHATTIRQLVFAHTGNDQIADDCTSETFARAIRHIHNFQCRGAGVRPWLVTIARNVSRDTARKASTRLEAPTPALPEARDDDADPARHVQRRQAREELERHIAALSDDQATCVRLRFFAQRSVAETAHSMHRAESAIRALQHRALRKLAAMYATDIGTVSRGGGR